MRVILNIERKMEIKLMEIYVGFHVVNPAQLHNEIYQKCFLMME